MKKNSRIIAALLTCSIMLSAAPIPSSAADVSDTVLTICPTKPLNSVSKNLFGVNHRYYDDGVGMYDSVNKTVYPEFLKAYNDIGFPSMRYPGGTVANTFVWKDSIGPQEQRKKMVHGQVLNLSPQTANFGLDEAARFCEDTHTDLSYVYNMGNGNAMDCADLVEYMNAPNDGSNPNGGVDWAAVRAQNGHSEPYHIDTIELGNEMYIPGQYYWLENRTELSFEKNYIFGGEVAFKNQKLTLYDDWRDSAAESDGTANQVKYVRYKPIVPDNLTVKVGNASWNYVADLSQAAPEEPVYTVNYEEGKITFGDGVHGAIPATGAVITASYTAKRDGFNDYYKAVKSIDPTVKVYSCFHSDKFINLMGDVHPYDGVVVHPYAQFMPLEVKMENYHENIMLEADAQMQDVLKIQTKIMNTVSSERRNEVKIMATEYGILSNGAPESGYLYSIDHGLFVSKCLMKMMEMGLDKAHKHCLIDIAEGSTLGPGGQAVISGNPDFVESATGYAIKLFREMSGSKRLESHIVNNPIHYTHNHKALDKLNMISTIDESGNVYVIVANVDSTDAVTATIHFEDFMPDDVAEVKAITTESNLDHNDTTNREKVVIRTETIEMQNDLSYCFPAHSLTAFKVSGTVQKAPVPTDTPVAQWNFDSQTNDIVHDLVGTHDMLLKNGANLEMLSADNGVLKVTASSDYAQMPAVVDLHSSDMTASLLIRLDQDLGTKQIILQQGGTYGTTWLYRNINGCLASYIGGNYILSNAYIAPNKWYHVAVVKEGTTIKLYMNGKLAAYQTSTVDHISTADMYIGQHKIPTLTERDWDGAIDQLSIYDHALTGNQIEQLYLESLPFISQR